MFLEGEGVAATGGAVTLESPGVVAASDVGGVTAVSVLSGPGVSCGPACSALESGSGARGAVGTGTSTVWSPDSASIG